jgi:hypothetical protein
VATAAGIEIEAGTESIRNSFHLRKLWYSMIIKKIKFTRRQSGERRTSSSASADARISLSETAHHRQAKTGQACPRTPGTQESQNCHVYLLTVTSRGKREIIGS